jgi:hypothetical protein
MYDQVKNSGLPFSSQATAMPSVPTHPSPLWLWINRTDPSHVRFSWTGAIIFVAVLVGSSAMITFSDYWASNTGRQVKAQEQEVGLLRRAMKLGRK